MLSSFVWPVYLPLLVGNRLGDLVARMLEE